MSVSLSDPVPRAARLERALADGLTLPPAGRIGVLRPGASDSFAPLDRARLHMVQGFRPDHDALADAGYAVSATAQGPYAAVLVCVPRAKAQARALIAQAARLTTGAVIVDGQKTDGIDSLLRDLRARCVIDGTIARAHGKLFWFTPGDTRFDDWTTQPQRLDDPEVPGFVTLPGVFSADGVDAGSRLLAQALPNDLAGCVVDLGAGWGYLAARALRCAGVQTLHLIEAEHDALACARANLNDPRARFHWADAMQFSLPEPADIVITNPPFHAGRAVRAELGRGFIASAARLLGSRGVVWLVANRHLPYADALQARFRTVDIVAETPGFRVFRASHPLKMPSGGTSAPQRRR